MTGTLWVVATPIGNLEDITLRALRILREAERVLAEDTRRTKTLLSHHGIGTPLVSLHAHTSEARIETLADELAEGRKFALVTDAGTPLVSDPGSELVQAAIARGVKVEAIPGASAVIGALCVAGVSADHFRFVGFLPRSGKRRRTALDDILRDRLTTVLFESPNRLVDTLVDLRTTCGGNRKAAVCRELTKLHEEVARGSLEELCQHFPESPRGEITIVVEGASGYDSSDDSEEVDPADVDALIRARLEAGLGTKEIARELAAQLGMDKREAYRRIVALSTKPE